MLVFWLLMDIRLPAAPDTSNVVNVFVVPASNLRLWAAVPESVRSLNVLEP